MALVYALAAMVGLYLAAYVPMERAIRQRALIRFNDEMKAIQLRYSRLAFSALRDLKADEIEHRYGLSQSYHQVRQRRSF